MVESYNFKIVIEGANANVFEYMKKNLFQTEYVEIQGPLRHIKLRIQRDNRQFILNIYVGNENIDSHSLSILYRGAHQIGLIIDLGMNYETWNYYELIMKILKSTRNNPLFCLLVFQNQSQEVQKLHIHRLFELQLLMTWVIKTPIYVFNFELDETDAKIKLNQEEFKKLWSYNLTHFQQNNSNFIDSETNIELQNAYKIYQSKEFKDLTSTVYYTDDLSLEFFCVKKISDDFPNALSYTLKNISNTLLNIIQKSEERLGLLRLQQQHTSELIEFYEFLIFLNEMYNKPTLEK